MDIDDIEKGDRILFNQRKQPLIVTKKDTKLLIAEGPKGAKYEIYTDNGTTLVSKEGNRRYSSYCNNLRKVGKWNREGDVWTHSKTEAKIRLTERENGFWNIRQDGIKSKIDSPLYGYTDKEAALEDIESFLLNHPQG